MVPEHFEPYVGPRPFENEDRNIFFGRPHEVSMIVSLIVAHQAVIIYAPSGAGKTSLLNAGVIPRLGQDGFEIVLGRVLDWRGTQVAAEEIQNIFIFNFLLSSGPSDTNITELASVTLAEYLQQMERPTDEIGQPLPIVLVFDQLEELFTTHLDRWQDRQAFFDQIRKALDADHLLRVVFLLREEFVGEIESYTHILRQGLLPRFRVERLRAADALRAVTAPLAATGRSFAEGVAEKIVADLAQITVEDAAGKIRVVPGEFIDPVQLQLVMQDVWNKLRADESVITENSIPDAGNLDAPLAKYYEDVVRKAVSRSDKISEEDLREWFERFLISPAGMRAPVIRGEETTEGVPNEVIQVLENCHFLKGERVRGKLIYELCHDRFIRPIQASNKRFFQSNIPHH